MSQFQESSTLQGGHAPPFCRQFSIFVPNQVGILSKARPLDHVVILT